jgi:hypothetical protein
MSYRIRIQIERQSKVEEYIDNYIIDEDEGIYFDLPGETIELHDGLDLEQFTVIDEFKEQEYKPYKLNKLSFQIILDYYKNLICEDYSEREKKIDNFKDLDEREKEFLLNSIGNQSHRIKSYFKSLSYENKNIRSSGLFLLDYFYLVDLYDNMHEDECVILTHG